MSKRMLPGRMNFYVVFVAEFAGIKQQFKVFPFFIKLCLICRSPIRAGVALGKIRTDDI